MKNLLIRWILPLSLALFLVAGIKIFFLASLTMRDSSMNATISQNDRVFYLKSVHGKRNSVVIYKPDAEVDSFEVKRLVGLPGDTIRIFNSIVYVNSKRLADEPGISYQYIFKTDSVINTSNFLIDNSLSYNFTRSYLGVFSCITNIDGLKIISSDSLIKDVRRKITEFSFSSKGNSSFGSAFYWNADNLGPVIIPRKGMQVKLGQKALLMYKEVIENEMGEQASFQNGKCFLGKKVIDLYTFKNNYFFLLNDNRNDDDDSRIKGFVTEKQMIGRYLFRM